MAVLQDSDSNYVTVEMFYNDPDLRARMVAYAKRYPNFFARGADAQDQIDTSQQDRTSGTQRD